MARIGLERPADIAHIRAVNDLAFGQRHEGRLVDLLREQHLVLCSLVAADEAGIHGHVLFSRLSLRTASGRDIACAALGPVCVHPDRQRQGIGAGLIEAGLVACAQLGIGVVILLGHPSYYPRFGFSAELGRRLQHPYASHGEAWMALELVPGILGEETGTVEYPAPWSMFD